MTLFRKAKPQWELDLEKKDGVGPEAHERPPLVPFMFQAPGIRNYVLLFQAPSGQPFLDYATPTKAMARTIPASRMEEAFVTALLMHVGPYKA